MRKMGGYGLPHCLRITIGSEAETPRHGRSAGRIRRRAGWSAAGSRRAMSEPLFQRIALIGLG